jgi:tricorn protease
MFMKKLTLLAALTSTYFMAAAQIDARLFRYPDVSQSQIAFVYGGDVWIVPKAGGTATRLTSSTGEEAFPRFSPDGKTLAFSATYDGNTDVYTMPVAGGVPARLTWHAAPDRVVEWHPDGNKILIASGRESGSQAFRQFYLLPVKGGLPEKLPVPYGELASFSPDGNNLAYVTKITENYPFKRYLGGLASDVLIFDLKNRTAENITKSPATEGKPAWYKNRIYFVSDAGSNRRRNIWMYDNAKKAKEQLTNFEDVDINSMSSGRDDLVFEAGGRLYLLNCATNKYSEVKINVVTDISTLMARTVNVSGNITNFDISPDAKRAVFEARGELFSIPAEYGVIINLTNTSGAFEKYPAWSPNGKWIAYWSDASGENEIYLRDAVTGSSKKMTSFGKGMGWQLRWSPDSKKLAFIDDRQNIKIMTAADGNVDAVDRTSTLTYSSLQGFEVSWSPDSKWIAYSKTLPNQNSAIFLYNLDQKKVYQVTSGYYNDNRPRFDPSGKYLYFATDRSFSPSYSNMDATWIYPNSTQLAVATLDPSTQSVLYARNDDVKVIDTGAAATAEKKPAPPSTNTNTDTAKKQAKPVAAGNKIVPENLEARIEILPTPAGNYGQIYAADGKLIYMRFPNTGAGPGPASIYVYDLEKREEKTLLANAFGFALTKDGKSIMVREARGFGIVRPAPDQRIEKVLPTQDMEMVLNPREEWKEIFNDTWRRYRDFFYDPSMHQVNWNDIRKQYGALIDDAITRWDVNNIQQEMISELSAGHTYAGGGDLEQPKNRVHGLLGIDWAVDNNAYKIKRIVRAGKWDNEVRSPFDYSGVNVKEGDYILSVNGRELDTKMDPYAMFDGLAGKAVALRVNDKPTLEGSRQVIIKTLNPQEEVRLRHLEWIEGNRKKVEELSGGKLGYIYMPNTGTQGQTELLRQFYAQVDKEGFVIDERFNAGGQLADRFIELLNRPILYNLAWRNADVTVWPIKGNNAPKVMLINGWAGSGGDAFPWAFQQLKLGPIVGERTLGILVGPATGHALIDGGFITVPDARLYGADGKWFAEGYGIKPEIEIWDDPAQLAKGTDPQLVAAVNEALKLVKTNPRVLHKRPPFEDRSAKGLKGF